MLASEFREELHKLAYTAQVNQRYHQTKQHRQWLWDKGAKIGVAMLAVLALLAAFLPHEWKWAEIALASLAAVAAVALNVIPVGEWVTESGEMFRSWSDLLRDAEMLSLKVRDLGDAAEVPAHRIEQLEEAIGRQCQLDAMEHAADDPLLARCQGDINERIYGKGVRTYAQALAAHQTPAGADHA